MLRQQSSAAGMRGAAAGAAPSCLRGEDGSARLSDELLQKAEERMALLSRELAEEISRNEQVPGLPHSKQCSWQCSPQECLDALIAPCAAACQRRSHVEACPCLCQCK